MAEPRPRIISAIDGEPELGREPHPVDVGDAASVKDAIKDSKQETATEAETIKWIMGEEKGRKFIYSFLSTFRAYENPYVPNSDATAFNCGEKNAALWMLTRIESADPALYLRMIEENRNG